ncbi:hypothetical protein ACWDBO_14305 [Streptomyces mirabilis]|uniref:hypothetical protein n=1 Tax=Streptomyces mirabilis TaxID=68239 RepID=UPI00333472D7
MEALAEALVDALVDALGRPDDGPRPAPPDPPHAASSTTPATAVQPAHHRIARLRPSARIPTNTSMPASRGTVRRKRRTDVLASASVAAHGGEHTAVPQDVDAEARVDASCRPCGVSMMPGEREHARAPTGPRRTASFRAARLGQQRGPDEVADICTEFEATRWMVSAAWLPDQGRPHSKEAAMATL